MLASLSFDTNGRFIGRNPPRLELTAATLHALCGLPRLSGARTVGWRSPRHCNRGSRIVPVHSGVLRARRWCVRLAHQACLARLARGQNVPTRGLRIMRHPRVEPQRFCSRASSLASGSHCLASDPAFGFGFGFPWRTGLKRRALGGGGGEPSVFLWALTLCLSLSPSCNHSTLLRAAGAQATRAARHTCALPASSAAAPSSRPPLAGRALLPTPTA